MRKVTKITEEKMVYKIHSEQGQSKMIDLTRKDDGEWELRFPNNAFFLIQSEVDAIAEIMKKLNKGVKRK